MMHATTDAHESLGIQALLCAWPPESRFLVQEVRSKLRKIQLPIHISSSQEKSRLVPHNSP